MKNFNYYLFSILLLFLCNTASASYPPWGEPGTGTNTNFNATFYVPTDIVDNGNVRFDIVIVSNEIQMVWNYEIKIYEDDLFDNLIFSQIFQVNEEVEAGEIFNQSFFTTETVSELLPDNTEEFYAEIVFWNYATITTSITEATLWTDDTLEENDEFETAADIGNGSTSILNLILSDDSDWYKFTTIEPNLICEIVINDFFNEAGNIDLFLYNQSEDMIGASISELNEENLQLYLPEIGEYYLWCYSADEGKGWYDLNLVLQPNFVNLSPIEMSVISEPGSYEVTVESNVSWTVSEDCDWLNISPGSGIGNGSFMVNYEANASTIERNCVITANVEGVTATHTIMQAGIESPEGLVAYYPFNGNATDESDNENDGTVNGATPADDRFGEENSAFYFDGIDSYVDCGNNESFNLTEQMTVCSWIKVDGTTDHWQTILGKFSGSVNSPGGGYGLLYQDEETNSAGFLLTNQPDGWKKSQTIDNNWVFVCGVYDKLENGNEALKFYINGIEGGEYWGNELELGQNEYSFKIGVNTTSASSIEHFFKGWIDDIRIYNRALNQDEITELYREGGWDPLTQGLVAYYPFTNGSTNDFSDNENNANNTGATPIADRFGNENSAFYFDETDYMIIEPAVLNVNTSFTVSAWVTLATLSPAGKTILYERTFDGDDDCGGYSAGNWGLQLYNQKLAHDISSVDEFDNCTHKRSFYDSETILNKWYHFISVYDKDAGSYKMYIDGVLINDSAVESKLRTIEDAVTRIGRNTNSTTQSWHGNIDDIRIYNRALNQDEITELYHEGGWDPLTQGLVAYYPFNGNAIDSTGNGNDGTVNGATPANDRFGAENSAYSFDGVSNNILVTNNTLYTIENDLSISVWVKANSNGVILAKQDGNVPQSIHYKIHLNTNGLYFVFAGVGAPSPYYSTYQLGSETYDIIANGGWHNIVVMHHFGTGDLTKILIDKMEYTGDWFLVEPIYPAAGLTTDMMIGKQQATSSGPLDGLIDDIRIYDCLISDSEIQELYHEGGWDPLSQGLVAYYPFTDTANDESGNENHGTVYGAQKTTDRFGNPNSAYEYNGTGDYINAGPLMDFTNTFSYTSWNYMQGPPPLTQWVTFFMTDNYCDNFGVMYDTSDNKKIRIYNEGCNGIGSIPYELSYGSWFMFTLTYDGSIMKTFINNELIDSFGYTANLNDDNDFLIGSMVGYNDTTYWWYGKNDDIRFYDRALTDSEINELYGDWNNLEANFDASLTEGAAPLEVQFTDLTTGNPTSWQWDFNNDGEIDSFEKDPEYTYTESSLYTVSLIVSDGTNHDTLIKVDYITVYEPVVADFTADTLIGPASFQVQFTDLSTGNPSSWLWDFNNDGVIDSDVSDPEWSYDEPENYTVTLIVSNDFDSDTLTEVDYISVYEPVQAEFDATPTVGMSPLQVQFNDSSSGIPISWQWDFGDGNASTDEDPEHTYTEPDLYTVSLTVSDGTNTDTEIKVDYITVDPPLFDAPYFCTINDVPNDQGRQVQAVWYKSILDTAYAPDNFYTLWRQDEIFGENSIGLLNPSEILKQENTIGKHFVWNRDGEVWSYISTIPAVMQEQYALVAPTLMDSCASGINYSTFKVLFHTSTAFYESEADEGYSVDNLAPHVPEDFRGYAADNSIHLNWSEPVDEDFQYFAIYKTDENGQFVEEPFATTISTEITDVINSEDHNYKVSAFDFNGNKSQGSEILAAQSISVNNGWTGVSSYVVPSFVEIENLVEVVNNELVILQNMTGMYWPGQNINTLGEWDINSGYYMKTSGETTLPIIGRKQQSTNLMLNAGWSLIPVLSDCPVEVSELFDMLDVTIIKEVAGYNIYWPALVINTLGQLQPGKAYFVLMESEGEIEFPECNLTLTGASTLSGHRGSGNLTESIDLSELNIQRTPLTHTIAIPNILGNEIEPGAIIYAFDNDENCFGASIWTEESMALTVFGDDPTTKAKDGFIDGEYIFFKANNPESREEYVCEVEFDNSLPNHDGSFVAHGLSAISELKLEALGVGNDQAGSITIYPNPAKDKIVVQMNSDGIYNVEIFDQLGSLVLSQTIFGKGNQLDVSSISSGVYLIKICNEQFSTVRKLVIE